MDATPSRGREPGHEQLVRQWLADGEERQHDGDGTCDEQCERDEEDEAGRRSRPTRRHDQRSEHREGDHLEQRAQCLVELQVLGRQRMADDRERDSGDEDCDEPVRPGRYLLGDAECEECEGECVAGPRTVSSIPPRGSRRNSPAPRSASAIPTSAPRDGLAREPERLMAAALPAPVASGEEEEHEWKREAVC